MRASPRRRPIERESRFFGELGHWHRAGLECPGSKGERGSNPDHTATLRFYAELNDFLPPETHQLTFVCKFRGAPAVKDLVESLGVPHTRIDLILVNGETQPFSYHVKDGDRISLFPMFESLDVTSLVRPRSTSA